MSIRPQEIIARKRDGKALSGADIDSFIAGVTSGTWADYQITALLMAMFTRGLNRREQGNITRAMLHSGTVMDLSDIDLPKADKHSTGGVGDKTSLIIAPVLAACGAAVPMISGRGLGHTGGTLDKLEAIPGYGVRLSFSQIKKVIRKCGLALAGQTDQIAPADRRLYALRDATATVPYIPLIVASIMSKKLAEGLDALVLDVKTGPGAFIQKFGESKKLASELCATGREFGVNTEALVTDMSEPLGKFVGNSVEVYECIRIMQGNAELSMTRTTELSVELAANLLVQCGVDKTPLAARSRVMASLASGDALERFRQNIELQGGDPKICDRPDRLLTKRLHEVSFTAEKTGYIYEVDPLAIGEAVAAVGGGRVRAEDKVDHAVAYSCEARIGDQVKAGDTLGVLYARSASDATAVSEKIRNAYKISEKQSGRPKLVRAKV